MKKIITITITLLFTLSLYAQSEKTVYRYVVKFNSECCGVPDAAPLLKSIVLFKKKNTVKSFTYYRIAPMGKEGEYYMAFQLKELTEKKLVSFMKQINATAFKMKSKGNVSTEENMIIDKQSLSGRTIVVKKKI